MLRQGLPRFLLNLKLQKRSRRIVQTHKLFVVALLHASAPGRALAASGLAGGRGLSNRDGAWRWAGMGAGRGWTGRGECLSERFQHGLGPSGDRGEDGRQAVCATNLFLDLALVIQKRLKRLVEVFLDKILYKLVIDSNEPHQ